MVHCYTSFLSSRGSFQLWTMAVCVQETWVLAFYDSGLGYYSWRCKDADENDASLIHPSEITQWDCQDSYGDYTWLDAVETTCNCPTTPSSCVDGDSFYLNVIGYSWDGLSTFDGCFSDSGYTFNYLTSYFRGGVRAYGEPAVYATDGYGSTVSNGNGSIHSRSFLPSFSTD